MTGVREMLIMGNGLVDILGAVWEHYNHYLRLMIPWFFPPIGTLDLPPLCHLMQRSEEGSQVRLWQKTWHRPHTDHKIYLDSSEFLRKYLPDRKGTGRANASGIFCILSS